MSRVRYQELDDVELLALVTIGRREALEALYQKYSTPVFSLSISMLRDREATEEITQDVFFNVWRRSASYQASRGSVSAWIFGIAHNRAVDELRRRRRRGPFADMEDLDMERYLLPSGAETDPLDRATLNETRRQVRRAINQLNAEQKDVVLLAYFKGYTHTEIAEKLQQPLGTVKTRMRLAVRKLKQVLKDDPIIFEHDDMKPLEE